MESETAKQFGWLHSSIVVMLEDLRPSAAVKMLLRGCEVAGELGEGGAAEALLSAALAVYERYAFPCLFLLHRNALYLQQQVFCFVVGASSFSVCKCMLWCRYCALPPSSVSGLVAMMQCVRGSRCLSESCVREVATRFRRYCTSLPVREDKVCSRSCARHLKSSHITAMHKVARAYSVYACSMDLQQHSVVFEWCQGCKALSAGANAVQPDACILAEIGRKRCKAACL